ncbi:MAG: hypothetical protein WCP35_19030, partial [Verrucomicrobiota bacterium]
VTLNGVTFKHYSSSSGSTLTFGTSGISMTYPATNLNFTGNNATTAYQQLRHNSMYAQNGSGTVTLSNLISGHNYQVQVWAPDWNGPIAAVFDSQVTIQGRNYSAGNHSQYAVGTFTADGTGQQVINFAAGPGGYCFAPTAVSLRDVSIPDPAITATGSPLSALSTTYGTASTATSFSVSGTNMTAGITVTPPAGLEVSTDSATTGFAGSGTAITVGSSGTIDSTTVWARLAATAAIGTYNSQNIVLSSSGAPSVNVTTAATGNIVIGGSTKLVITSTAVSTVAGVASGNITVQRQNDSGTPITDEASITVALSSDSSGSVTFTPSTLTIDNGSSSATFTYTDTKAGTPTLTAALSPLTPATQQETVTPDTASKLAFGVEPTTTTAGSAISPSVTVLVQDQYGNTVTTDTSSVTIGSSTTAFTIGSTLTVNADGGVATFSAIQPTTAGNNKTLTASDGSLAGATSSTFTVNGAAATQLVFTSTAVSTWAGTASGAITVQRQDQYNNPTMIEASRTVTLTSDSSGTVTFTPASLTIAYGSSSVSFTYTDTSVGTPTLTAASISPTAVTSATQTETVTAAPAIITWGAATDVTWSDSDVLTNGTAVAAVTTWRNADLPINSVTFSKYLSIAGGVMTFNTANISMAWTPGVPSNDNGAPVEQYCPNPQPNTTDNYKMLYYSCYGGNSSSGTHRGTITLSGLTVGQTYQVQVWAPQWNNNDYYQIGGVNVNIGNWNGTQVRQPQYLVGTFTATTTSQPIPWNAVSGGGTSYVPAAVSLRDVTGGSVSNYTTWAAAQVPPVTGGPAHVGPDGLTNLLVYALDLKTDGTNGSPGTLTGRVLSFAKRPDAVANNDVTYAIETSPNLQNPWTTTTTGVTDNSTTISIDLSTLGGSTQFARLVVTQK